MLTSEALIARVQELTAQLEEVHDLQARNGAEPDLVAIRPLVAGEPLSAFTRAAMAGDMASSLTHYGPNGLQFINADYTLTLSRLPEGELIGLASQSHSTQDGIATGSALLFDEHGEIGSSISVSVAQSGFAPPPR